MVVHYRNTLRDVLAFQLHHCIHDRNSIAMLLVFLGLNLYMGVAERPQDIPIPFQAAAILLVSLFLVAVMAAFLILWPVVGSRFGSHKMFLTDHKILIDEEGVTEETVFNKSFVAWPGIQRIRKTPEHLFVYIAGNAAHVIPRRACTTPEDWDALHAYIDGRVG